MKTQILEGKNVKLVPLALPGLRDVAVQGKVKGWEQATPSLQRSAKKDRKRREERFVMCTTTEDRIIGYIALNGFDWDSRSGWLGIGFGNPDSMRKTYTTEATQLMLRYAFKRLHLNRVNLNLLSCDEREIRSYEEMGFRYEGTQREVVPTANDHLDIIDMGILCSEWERLNRYPIDEAQGI